MINVNIIHVVKVKKNLVEVKLDLILPVFCFNNVINRDI